MYCLYCILQGTTSSDVTVNDTTSTTFVMTSREPTGNTEPCTVQFSLFVLSFQEKVIYYY